MLLFKNVVLRIDLKLILKFEFFLFFTRKSKYFIKGTLDWDKSSRAGKFVKESCKKLKNYAKDDAKPDSAQLINLAQKMLKYDMDERITISDALEHGFFKSISNENRIHEEDPRKKY